MTVSKGTKRGESQAVIEAAGWVLRPSPLRADWLTLQMLSCLSDLPAGLLRGLLGAESWSFFNCLTLHSDFF